MAISFNNNCSPLMICMILLLPALCYCSETYDSKATYYKTSDGKGTPSGACDYGEYGRYVSDGLVTAASWNKCGACGYGEYGRTVNSGAFCGVSKLYNNGTSCGACYQVKCKHPEYCNEEGTVVVVTDSGEEKADFILSFSAYAKLAKPLMVAKLVAQGEVEIEYQRVPCKYATGAHLMVKIHESSKFPNYLGIVLLNQGGLSDITAIEVWEESHKQWKSMVRIFGAVWAISYPPKGALKFRFQVRGSAGVVWVQPLKLIPSDWKAGVLIDTYIQLT